jgi:hypothetical protein
MSEGQALKMRHHVNRSPLRDDAPVAEEVLLMAMSVRATIHTRSTIDRSNCTKEYSLGVQYCNQNRALPHRYLLRHHTSSDSIHHCDTMIRIPLLLLLVIATAQAFAPIIAILPKRGATNLKVRYGIEQQLRCKLPASWP